ncbi:hypothetical protein GCM10017691_16650 [Pseudonocardia petroleophila]|uniref:Uncharacterized protein n=1 Tax=Pseudonocardia petroleophila TaxID=37331 RepID=A0A7G7MHK6_9PSEU|nr:hypothetical protein [Pseudonocardia petroleophila]QNG52267.1 hypothetical protein H6H00_30235 [Pseudonocardia petroleophila]
MTWTAQECADAWGVKIGTWHGYVSRGQAPAPLADGRTWDPDAVRTFRRPGVGRSRTGATPQAQELLAEMARVAADIDDLRIRQRELLVTGKQEGLEVLAMSRALGISRQTAANWLRDA